MHTMKRTINPLLKLLCYCLCCHLLLAACSEEEKPQNLPPVVSVEEAQEITRTSALISGKVEIMGKGEVNMLRFRYGSSAEMEKTEECPMEDIRHPHAELTGLKPNTTYYFCLEAGNGYDNVRSPVLQFTTMPNERPSIDHPQLLSQGPVSIILQYELLDDGGEPVTGTGCYYRADGGEEQHLASSVPSTSPDGKQLFKVHLGGLQPQTAYTVQVYAANSVGETRSESFSFYTDQAVLLTIPGSLPEIIGEDGKYLYSSLSFAGPLNGTDLRFLRDMLGKDIYNNETPGRMSVLNLTDASIVRGGMSYNATRYTATDTVGYGLFKSCLYLKELLLPQDARVIEENALEDCTALTVLRIPAYTRKITPSKGCTALEKIEVSEANDAFCTRDGVLYDKGCTRLLWFPEGKTGDLTLPATVERLDDYAFQGCHIRRFELPAGITEMGKGVFHASDIEEAILPANLKLLPYGTFQQCSRLTSVTLGEKTELLSEYCFDGCPLQDLYVKSPYPPVCQPATFAGAESLFKGCVLHVPKGSRNLYRLHETWKSFETIVEQ